MNLFKRAYYSVRNNLSKSLILFLVVFILGNVICGSLAITQSLKNTQEQFRKHYGAKVEISMNGDIDSYIFDSSNSKIKKVRNLLEEVISDEKLKFSYQDVDYYLSGFTSEALRFKDEDYIDVLDIKLCGVTNPKIGLIKNYKLELVEGRSFSEEEMNEGERVLLVSKDFQIKDNEEYRNIEVGDKIVFDRNIYSLDYELKHEESVEYEVIGILDRFENVMVENDRYSYDNHMARFYVPANTLFKEEKRFGELNLKYFADRNNTNNTSLLGNIYLQMEDHDGLNKLDDVMMDKIYIDETLIDTFRFSSTDEIYKKISAPIESMSGVANFLLISSSILCVLILSVAVFILIRNRRHEIGILISLGESKLKVILQIILEIYLVGMLALGFSMISGNELGKVYSNYLVGEQIEESRLDLSVDENKLQEEMLESYTFELTDDYIISVLSVGTLVMILSVLVPVGYIVRLKPKKILL